MSYTNNEGMDLAAQISRLEAELESARIETQLKKLQSELSAMGGSTATAAGKENNEEDYLVIEEEDHGDDDSYYEEYIEEEYYEDEEYVEEEESIEEYSEEEEPVCVVPPEPAPPVVRNTASSPPPKVHIQDSSKNAHLNLRQIPNNVIQKEMESVSLQVAPVAQNIPESAPPVAVPTQSNIQQQVKAKAVKTKVRPPPNQGGKPVVRIDPTEDVKRRKKFPLSGLIRRQDRNNNNSSAPSNENNDSNDGTYTNPVAVPKRGVPKKPLSSTSNESPSATVGTIAPSSMSPNKTGSVVVAAGATTTSATSYQRRVIPNLQPSPEGNETIFEQLVGSKLLINAKLQKCTTRGCLHNQEMIGLYFGASWKSDCKRFMPLLKNFYYATTNTQQFEIIYISADRSLIEFKDCYGKMPYLSIPAGTTALKNELTKTLKIIEMPALIILDEDANVVTVHGVQKIQELHDATTTTSTNSYTAMANELMEKWKKTRPIPMSEVKKDNTLLYNTIDRGTVYWN